MTSTISEITCNPHISALETALADAKKTIEFLVIAHNDPEMLSALSSAFAGESAVVLEISQNVWDFEGNQLPEAIEWALEVFDIRHLVLAGHTLAGGPLSRGSLTASATNKSEQDSYGKLIAGARFNNVRNRPAKDRLALQVKQLLELPIVKNRCRNGELSVYGLLYRAESGLFMAYDTNQDTFKPLVA
jgi:carbonic anhydrase